jgi:outer membrane autotransporter protein
VEISGLLKGYGTVSGKDVKFTSQYSDNLGELSASQREALGAVNAMLASLNQDSRKSELRKIYNLDAGSTKRALDQIGYSPAPQMMSAVQAGSVANRAISDRLSAAFSPQEVSADVPVPVNRSVDGAEDKALTVPVKLEVPVQADNDVWVKFTKNWGELKGDADYHGQAISGGYDRAIGKHWRGGLFVSYDAKSLGADHSGGNMYDTRFGVYGGYHRNADDAFIYMDGGRIRNKLHRSIPALGLGTEAKYHSNIFEIGGEYRHNLQPERTWQISPFVNLQYSSMKQEAFAETGAGIFNHRVDAKRNNYFAGQLGVEFKRQLRHGHYAARIGVKYAFAGADPALSFSYEGDAGHAYRLENNQDKTHVVLSIGGENEFAHGWMLGGDVQLQKGRHDRDVSASVMVRKVW